LLKVHLSVKQYCPLKSQFGIKTSKLCEASSSYLWFSLACIRQETFGIYPHFERHTENDSNSSETLWPCSMKTLCYGLIITVHL
jgi:hypothetical protein